MTKISDTELNRRIVDFLNETVAVEYSHFNKLIKKTAYTYDEAMSCYCAEIQSADEIIPQPERARQLCRQREADPQFLQQFRSYKKKLAFVSKDPVKGYKSKRNLLERIQKRS